MKILLDAFGGDNSPNEIIKGAVDYVSSGGSAEITLVGKVDVIKKIIEENGYSDKNLSYLNATEVITCEEAPTEAFRKKPDSTITVSMSALRSGEYGAFVSAGSTGAVLTAAVLKAGRVKGVIRPGLGTILPSISGNPVMFMDVGANADCKPEYLVQFAIMADTYMKKIYGLKNPKIALLCNGTEDEKGSSFTHTVFKALKQVDGINFVGNIEGRDILTGNYDIVVTDGFSGNVAIKSTEGAANAIIAILKKNILASFKAKLGFLLMKKAFKNTMKEVDYNNRGGAVLLGINGVIVKSHGSSKAPAIVASLYQAEKAVKEDIKSEISARLCDEKLKEIVYE
ncbi:MAG: phosphate acyltransferase PlsX [Clostridia bacterium]|jgi:glycerol-3-phosphate acyltransferase PlsX|nr:phosphate acyltransferase PlsX [Clostridia bacterium]